MPPLPKPKYSVEIESHAPTPSLSHSNAAGKGASPCRESVCLSGLHVAAEHVPSRPYLDAISACLLLLPGRYPSVNPQCNVI